MNKKERVGPDGPDLAATRLSEIDDLSQDIRIRLQEMADDLKVVSAANLNAITNKLDLLHAAHLKVLAAEDKFHAKVGIDPDQDAIDYGEVRAEIGSRLNRFRESLMAEGFSCDADTRAACDAALSVRLLGDAPSDRSER